MDAHTEHESLEERTEDGRESAVMTKTPRSFAFACRFGAVFTARHSSKLLASTGLLALTLCASAVEVRGVETNPGKIGGKVFSVAPNGERYVISGAEVVLTPAPGPHPLGEPPITPRTTTADATGQFTFQDIPMGCYRVIATSAGLTTQGQQTCLLAQGAEIILEIDMTLGVVTASVDVVSRIENVDPTESSATGAIETSTLRSAPSLTEQFDSYLPLLPGVVRGPDGLISMKGARTAQSGSLVNSANATDPYTGASAINLPIDVVSGVRVLSNPYDSEYGKFAGAISTVDTKTSDFNKPHYVIQNFVPGLKRRDDHFTGIGKFIPRQTISLPLVRNRIAFTQSLEYRYVQTEIKKAGLPPLHDDTGLESFDSFTRVDFQVSSRHTAAVNLSVYPQKLNYFGLNTFTPQPSTPDLRQRGYMAAAQDQYAFNSGSLLESRLSYKTFDADVRANSTGLYRRELETTTGAFFNLQHRETSRFEYAEIYHFAPLQAHGQHLVKAGWNLARETYDGRQSFSPTQFLGVSGRLVQRVDFSPPTLLDIHQEQYTAFVQDKWTVWPRFTLDAGLRFDRNSTAQEAHASPRAGFSYTLTGDNKTVLRGGFGLFYDRVNLNTAAFLDLPQRTETRFTPAGALIASRLYRHSLQGGFRDPRSAGWSLQFDREVMPDLYVRVGFQQRVTSRNYVLTPETTVQGDFLTLGNNGRDRYREFEVTARYHLREKSQLTASYVRSSAMGNLNDFNTFFGNVAAPSVRPDERSRLSFDVPNRFLFWADLRAPFKLTVSPVLDIHTGFPYSIVNEDRDFVGRRNYAGRFPTFASTDIQVLRPVRLLIIHKKARVGVRLFNIFNHFNPVDIQNNLASSRFGVFSNSRDRLVSGKLVLEY